jgi:hypothetical protein
MLEIFMTIIYSDLKIWNKEILNYSLPQGSHKIVALVYHLQNHQKFKEMYAILKHTRIILFQRS